MKVYMKNYTPSQTGCIAYSLVVFKVIFLFVLCFIRKRSIIEPYPVFGRWLLEFYKGTK